MKILIKLTSRSRPEKFFKTVESICNNSRTDDWVIVATLDKDDETMNNKEVLDRLDENGHLIYNFGDRAEGGSKIHAINRDLNTVGYFADWQILISISDDQIVAPGFDEQIIADMAKHFPDTDGFLMYNDKNQKDNVSTMSIMGRKYCEYVSRELYGLDELVIYHPAYLSLWVDVEATEIAHILGKLHYGGDHVDVFEHLHPTSHDKFGKPKSEWDEQYRSYENKALWDIDKATLLKRRADYYGIPESLRVNGFKYKNL